MALFAVIDEACLERGLDAGDDAFVDVRLALFASSRLDIDVETSRFRDDRAQIANADVDANDWDEGEDKEAYRPTGAVHVYEVVHGLATL